MRGINSRTGWRCAAGAAALWDTEQQRAGAACCLLQLGVCTGFFTSVKRVAWGRKEPHCAGRCWSEGDRVVALTGAVGGPAGSAPSTSTQPELWHCLSCRALLELAEMFAGGIALERACSRICPPHICWLQTPRPCCCGPAGRSELTHQCCCFHLDSSSQHTTSEKQRDCKRSLRPN